VPEGEGPFATILHTHGGPILAATETFDPECQAWVDQGFAYCSINYRGSITFGRDFQERIYGDLGHLEVEDMVAARDWLVGQGVAKSDQIFLAGRSYGGFLTLQALGLRPDLWAGGMAGVPVTDWAMQYEDCAGSLRGAILALLGTPEDKPEQFAKSSPITYVDRVAAPVLILHNRNDTRCPARPVEEYEKRMRALGKPIEVHWYDAGHLGAIAEREQGIREQEWMLEFAYRVLREPASVG
jgi:dipeptidyl aminopeptidase/acylaminoacyl peptidase